MMQTEELVAGPELDVRVAAVMRRQVTGTLYESVGGTGGMRAGIGPYRGLVTAEEGCWSPSTDIGAAWQVVEHLRTQGVEMTIHPYANKPWEVCISTIDDWHAKADSAPLAICLAALKAMNTT